MLGKITRDVRDMLATLHGSDFQAEYKYDGVRAQIHLECATGRRADAHLSMFSRHLEDVTTRYPDALTALLDALTLEEGDVTHSAVGGESDVAHNTVGGERGPSIRTAETLGGTADNGVRRGGNGSSHVNDSTSVNGLAR